MSIKNIAENYTWNFVPGDMYRAMVKNVRMNGVSVEMPGSGSGTISTRCWGYGIERANALAKIRPGDEYDVSVRSYDPRTKSLSLVLCGFEDLAPLVKKQKPTKTPVVKSWADLVQYKRSTVTPKQNWVNEAKKPIPLSSEKPVFKPIPKNSVLALDLANLLGALKADEYIPVLCQIFDGLAKNGYANAIGFIEKRTICWFRHNAPTPSDVDALDAFCRDSRITVVGGESDLAMLQTAKAVANAVIVTRDHLADYQDEFGEIVGSPRVRSFGIVRLPGDQLLINIDGVSDAVVISKTLKSIAA